MQSRLQKNSMYRSKTKALDEMTLEELCGKMWAFFLKLATGDKTGHPGSGFVAALITEVKQLYKVLLPEQGAPLCAWVEVWLCSKMLQAN